MDLENQEVEAEVNTEAQVETDIIEEPIVEEPIVEDLDNELEVTGEDALAILAGEDETPADDINLEAEGALDIKADDEANTEAEETPEVKADNESKEDAEILESITNERTRERFQSLSHKNKELIESGKQQTQVIDTFRSQVESTGMNSEDFSQTISMMAMANSNDIEDVKKAREFVRSLDKTLTGRIGDTADAYEQFDDLKQDYEDGEANEKYVNLEAQRRIQEQQHQAQAQQQQQQQSAQERAVAEQGNAIQSMIGQFKTSDPDFALKEAQLEGVAMKIVQDGVPMAQWATEFVNRYHSINVDQRKPSPAPMSSSRRAQNVNNFAGANVSDEQANHDFAMSLLR